MYFAAEWSRRELASLIPLAKEMDQSKKAQSAFVLFRSKEN